MKKGRKVFALILLTSLLMLSGTINAGATSEADGIENEVKEENSNAFPNTSPWSKDTQDDSIYENAVDTSEENQDIKIKKPGRVEKYIAELFRNIGSGVINLLQENVGISLDSIIYGRVGSGQPNKVNIFAFELRKGNPYGVAGAVCYSLIRGMIFAFLGIQFAAALAKAAWTGQTAKSREEIKSMFPAMILKFTILMLMPYLLDVAIYVRDVVLYGIKDVTGQMVTGGATLSMSKAFLVSAERSGTFIDALMYLGTVALSIYFMFLYVALAMDMLICFVAFPVMCLLHNQKRDLFHGWIMSIFSNILTPVIDAMLLLIPLLTSLMLSDTIRGVSIIQLIMCLLIIPARGRMKSLLGVQSNERNGFLGAMAMMALARAAVGGVKRGFGKAGEMLGDIKKSRTEGELADIDREEEDYLTGSGALMERKNIQEIAGISGGKGENNNQERLFNEEGDNPDHSDLPVSVPTELQGKDFDIPDDVSNGADGCGPVPSILNGSFAMEGEEGRNRNDRLRELDDERCRREGSIDALRVERAGAMKEDKRIKREMLDYDRGSEEYQALEREKGDNENRVAAIDEQIAGQNQRLNEIRRQKETLSVGSSTKRIPTTFDERRDHVMAKRADISNFETPEFKSVLSHEQKQSLYRKRAAVNAGKLVAGMGASVGAGAALGGASVFIGPSGAALAAAGGMEVGGVLGEAAVDRAVSAGSSVNQAYHSVKNFGSGIASQAVLNYVQPAAASVELPFDNPVPMPESRLDEDISQPLQQPNLSKKKIQTDANNAFFKVLDLEGSMKNSGALQALKEANVSVEKYIVSMKEENIQVSKEIEVEKRIEAQTEALVQEVMKQMETSQEYKKGTPGYEMSKALILEKVHEIVERNNQLL